ncbi:MAG: hypothetical protein ACUZ8E_10140 [Candidatus Anammoxibacter sp.]
MANAENSIFRFGFIFILITGCLLSGSPVFNALKMQDAYAAVTNIFPASQIGDSTGETISEITGDDSAVNPDTLSKINAGDNTYSVDKSDVLFFDTFDTSSITGVTILGVVLHLEYGAENGYSPTTTFVRYANGGSLTNTTINPTDIAGWSGDLTYDLFAQGVDTVSEIEALDIEFTNDDKPQGAADAIHFDYLWLTVTYTPTLTTTTTSTTIPAPPQLRGQLRPMPGTGLRSVPNTRPRSKPRP